MLVDNFERIKKISWRFWCCDNELHSEILLAFNLFTLHHCCTLEFVMSDLVVLRIIFSWCLLVLQLGILGERYKIFPNWSYWKKIHSNLKRRYLLSRQTLDNQTVKYQGHGKMEFFEYSDTIIISHNKRRLIKITKTPAAEILLTLQGLVWN